LETSLNVPEKGGEGKGKEDHIARQYEGKKIIQMKIYVIETIRGKKKEKKERGGKKSLRLTGSGGRPLIFYKTFPTKGKERGKKRCCISKAKKGKEGKVPCDLLLYIAQGGGGGNGEGKKSLKNNN